jgi:hypothetical protein
MAFRNLNVPVNLTLNMIMSGSDVNEGAASQERHYRMSERVSQEPLPAKKSINGTIWTDLKKCPLNIKRNSSRQLLTARSLTKTGTV